jgi:hypothetical protein
MASSKKPTPNGKGDRDRSDPKKYAEGYDRIFGKRKRAKKAKDGLRKPRT